MSRPARVDAGRVALMVSGLMVLTGTAWSQPRLAVNGVDSPAGVSVAAGSVVSVVVSDGPANTTDWIGFYPVGAADTAYLVWYYLNGATSPPPTGLTHATLNVLVPVIPGTYEVRLLAANGFARLATSGTITVAPSSATIRVNDTVPPAALQMSPASPIVATIVNGPGNRGDWVGLFAVGTADTSYLSWQFLNGTTTLPSAGLTTATLQFFTPSSLGTYELRLFAGGGYARLAVSATLVVGPSEATLSVNGVTPPAPVTATAGSVAAVTVAGAPGNATDWIGLYAAGAADTAYLQWRYLNGALTPPPTGTSDASLSFLMPTTPGAYEFRLYAHNAYERLASSSVVTVPVSSARLAVNGVDAPGAVTASAGMPLTVVLTHGPANPSDWVGLFAAVAADTSPIAWSYLDGHTTPPAQGLVAATLRFLAPVTSGTYEIRAFAANTFNRLAASGPLSVTPSQATIAVNGTNPPTGVTAPPASALAIQVTGGPGNPTDWIGPFRASDTDASPLTWQYLNGLTAPPAVGLTAASLTVTLPADAGAYEIRLFADNSYNRLATSNAVSAGFPAVTVNLTSPFPGTVFPASMPIALAASASATSGTVARVEFEVDGAVVAFASEPPYSVVWTSGLPGVHVVVAVAINNINGRTSTVPVSIAIAATGLGTLGPPLITPPGGTFGGDQTVTISAAPGATVRFTVDGSDPNETSPLYVGPFPIAQDATVMARAFQDGWFPSPSASATFVIDRTPPTMLAFLIPEANPAGWNNSPVTVSFRCADASGMRSCPAPVSITSEGSREVQGVALDAVGNQGTITTAVRVDRTAPSLVLSGDTSRQTPDASVTLTGSVADEGAGVARVACNGVGAALDAAGAFTCEVPVQPGLNAVVVQAVDLASNGRSAGLRVTRVGPVGAIQVSPVAATIGVGETRDVWSLDQAGQSVPNAEWAVDNSAVLALTTTDGRVSVAGLSAGLATVTATLGNLTASATITVVTGTLPVSTVRWTSAPGVPGAVIGSGPLFANRVDASVPDLYVLEHTPAGSQLLHGVFADGTPGSVWTVSPDSSSVASLSLADGDGGAILDSWSWSNGSQRAVVRIPGTADALPWRYDPPTIDSAVVGQSPEGTIYLLEHVGQSWQVVGLEGATGAVKFRYTPPGTSHYALYNIDCHAGYHSISESGPELSLGVVGYDGALYAIARTSTSVYDYFSQEGCHASGATPTELHATVSVVRVTADGAGRVDELQTKAGTSQEALDLYGDTLVPDPRGGVHAQWNSLSFDWNTYEQTGDTRHARVGAESSSEQQMGILPFDRIGDGVGFDASGVAYDLDTMAVKFSPAVAGTFITSLTGGGVALADGITLTELDDTGAVVREEPMPVIPAPSAARMAMFEGAGTNPSYGGGDLWIAVAADGLEVYEGPGFAANTDEYPDRNGALQPETKRYPTPESAVIDFYRKSWRSSTKEQREYGGKVCRKSSTDFRLTPPTKGPLCTPTECEIDLDTESCPEGQTTLGEYHTHPWAVYFDGTNGPSGLDRARILAQARVWSSWPTSYVGTSCGEVWFYTPVRGQYEVAQGNLIFPGGRYVLFDTGVFGQRPPCSHAK
jgi:hypothetical protein